MCEFDSQTPSYLTDLSQIKSRLVPSPLDFSLTKIIDPTIFSPPSNPQNLIKSQHLSRKFNPAFSYSLEFHTSQNKNLIKPSIRKDVAYLENWLNEMLENVKKKPKYCFNLLIEDLQIIYSACLKELIRQISLHCSERGQLMEKIWNSYVDLLEKAILSSNKEKEKLEKGYLDEITRIYAIFEKESGNFKKEIEGFKKEKMENDEKMNKNWEELIYLRTKFHRLEKENGFLRGNSEDLTKELKNMAKELYSYQTNEVVFEQKLEKFPWENSRKNMKEKKENFLIKEGKEMEKAIAEAIENEGIDLEEGILCEKATNTEENDISPRNHEKIREIPDKIIEIPGEIPDKNEGNMVIFDKIAGKTESTSCIKIFEEIRFFDKEIQADLCEFLPSPSTKGEGKTFEFDEILLKKQRDSLELKEKYASEMIRKYEKMGKSIGKGEEIKRKKEKLIEIMEIGKENLMENVEYKREIVVLREEITRFLKENKKLRYTYQKNISELEENKEKNLILNGNYQDLEMKVRNSRFFFDFYKIFSWKSIRNYCRISKKMGLQVLEGFLS